MSGRRTAARGTRTRNVHGGVDRRELILMAASRRFAEFGYEATTVRQIADDVDILSGSLYHYFATKEEILAEIVRDAALEQRDRARRVAAAPSMDAERKLVLLVREELAALAERREAYAIIFNERKFFRRSPDFAYVIGARKEAYQAWVGVLEQGLEEGLFHAGIDTYLTVSTILRMLNSGADWYRNEDGSPIDAAATYSLQALSDFYVDFVLRSVRAADRAAQPIPPAG